MEPGAVIALLALVVSGQRLAELNLARRHERRARAEGALEYGASHYPLFFLLHIGWLAGWIVEGLWRDVAPASGWPYWLAAFLVAQALRYWAIATLGWRWNTRILVVPGLAPIRSGPYRFLRHPNYLAVAIELLSVPMIAGAWVTGVAASVINAGLLLGVRIPVENGAVGEDVARRYDRHDG